MPSVVPTLIQDTEQLQTGTGRQRSQADASAFGGQEARAVSQLGGTLGAVGDELARREDEFAETEGLELDNLYSRRIRERFYNTENGYLSTQRGRAAVDGRAGVETELGGIADEIAATTQNARAQAAFRRRAEVRFNNALGDVATHAATQHREYQNEQSEGVIQEAIDNAVAAYADPIAVAGNTDIAIGELQRVSDREGWSPEILQNRVRQLRSDMTSRVILQLAATNPEQADEMYRLARPSLSAQEAGNLLTGMNAVRAQARERVTGAVWQALANGQDPRSLSEWQEFTTNPLFGREHESFNEYRRQRARDSVTNALSTRRSELAGDTLEATGASNPRAFMLMTDLATGRLDVRSRQPRRAAPDMTPEEFQRETGYTPEQARAIFAAMNPDDLRRVLDRRSGQTDNSAIDRANDDILRVAEPMAQSMGLAVTGDAARNAETRGAFRAYIWREARAHVLATGQRPDDATVQAIARRALLHVDSAGRPNTDGNRYAFQPVPYDRIPRGDREAIENNWRLQRGTQPTRADVERRYAEYLRSQQ